MIHYLEPSQTDEIRQYYEENGYVVIKNALPDNKIDNLIKKYEILKTSPSYYFRSQDTNRFEKLTVNQEGFLEHSILNPIDLLFQNQFRNSVTDIIFSAEISKFLTTLTSEEKHVVWQTMFFDKSTGTVAHQDHYYLDSNPPGNLVACWFALETIHEDAGPFFVVPRSHKGPLIQRDLGAARFSDHNSYVEKIQQLIIDQQYQAQPMALEKGSILFWHPFLLHGAFSNINPHHSRKSLTAHYLPNCYGQLGLKNKRPTANTFNPSILSWKKPLSVHIKEHLQYAVNLIKVNARSQNNTPKMDMRGTEVVSITKN
jgi:phytanoyl-CoA hydroxylase